MVGIVWLVGLDRGLRRAALSQRPRAGDAVSAAVLHHRRPRRAGFRPCRSPPSSWRRPARRSCSAAFCSAAGRARNARLAGDRRDLAVWAGLHVQYDWTGDAADFRHRPVSGLDALAQRLDAADLLLHALFNLEGTLETLVQVPLLSRNSRASAIARKCGRRRQRSRSLLRPGADFCRGSPITGSAKRAIAATVSSSGTVELGVSLTMIARTFRSRRYSASSAVRVWLMVPR